MTRLISLFDVRPLFEQLAGGQLILTPNQRLASRICSAYAIACQQKGQDVVQRPAVFSMNHWIDHCWQRLLISGQSLAINVKPLSTMQEQAIWEQIVSDSDLGSALLRPSATALQAASAYRTLVDWQQDLSDSALRQSFLHGEDSTVLLNWVERFEQRCAIENWLPTARLPERVLSAFTEGVLKSFGDITGIGFDDIAPLQQALLGVAGNFQHFNSGRGTGNVNVARCESADQEILAAAVWAKQTLKDDDQAVVGIVVPDLAQQRQKVQRILLEVFEPGYNAPVNDGEAKTRRNLPFNFSVGYPLLEAPVVDAAINILSLTMGSLDTDTLEVMCQSPFYLLEDNDADLLAQLIALIRDQQVFELSSAALRQLVRKVAAQSGRAEEIWPFAEALQELANIGRSQMQGKSRPMAEWVSLFTEMLTAMGWPGRRRLDSIEYQQVSQWQQALEMLVSQDFVLPPVSFSVAVSQLRSLLSQQIFQPQTADSSLQVLGTLEAAGLQFTHLWLQGMSELQWPPAPSPNPLLPFSLQREQRMPHATAQRELEYARHLTERLIQSADHVVVSSPAVIDDNPAAVSSLFEQYPQCTLVELLGRPLQGLVPLVEIRRRHFESQLLESYEALNAPVLDASERIRGGSYLFASQAACPFRSFVNHRLGVRALAQPQSGLSAADRGSVLHRALELLWQKLKTQQALLALDDDQRQSLCQDVARYALDEVSQRKITPLGVRYKQLEVERLQQLIVAWLAIECDRANFTVQSIEDRKVFQLGDLKLETRIDRIDQLDDGSLVIIDYKTGSTSVSRWWGERPDEPQLPLYSMLVDNGDSEVGGIAFAQLRADGCAVKAVGSEVSPEPQVTWNEKVKAQAGAMDWQQLKQQWNRVLIALASDFIAGKAIVDPKQPAQTCQFCDLASVCRVNHQPVESV